MAISFIGASSVQGTGVSSLTISNLNTTGADFLFVGAGHSGSNNVLVNTVTHNGDPCTERWNVVSVQSFVDSAGFTRVAPDQGTFDIVVTNVGPSDNYEYGIGAMCFSGVDQTTPVPAAASSNSGDDITNLSVSITSSADEYVVATLFQGSEGVSGATPGGSATEVFDEISIDSVREFAGSYQAHPVTAMSWSWSAAADFGAVLYAMRIAAATGAPSGGIPSGLTLLGVGR